MSDDRLVDILGDRGFEQVEAGLPGGWATDGGWTICIVSRPGPGLGSMDHEVTIYEKSAGLIGIGSEPAARVVDRSHGRAIRRALDRAGYEEGDDAESR